MMDGLGEYEKRRLNNIAKLESFRHKLNLKSFEEEYSLCEVSKPSFLPVVHIRHLKLTISSLKRLILDQTRQNGYQTVPFSVYIHNLMFAFILEYSKKRILLRCIKARVENNSFP